MALLLQTDIQQRVNRELAGSLVRIGGKVEQLYGYRNCTVDDINVDNRRSLRYGTSPVGRIRYAYDLLEQEVRFWRKGYRAVRDRRTMFVDIHKVGERPRLHRRYDGCLSSHVIEHSPNNLCMLLNMHLLVKENGRQFHALPHHEYTFDSYRSPTPVEHFVRDFEDRVDITHNTHAEELRELQRRKAFRRSKLGGKDNPYKHFHVFNEHTVRELFEYIFEDVTVDVMETERNADIVVLCSNRLSFGFAEKHGELVERYRVAAKH